MKIEAFQKKIVTIENSQSTFFTIKTGKDLFRFDFLEKKEFEIKKGCQAELKYFESHPLLIDYSENLITVYINSKPKNQDEFIEEMQIAINKITQGWRNWRNYVTDFGFFSFETFLKNINDGSGILLKAPFSIAQNVLKVCEKYNVAVNSFDNQLRRENFKLITIGESYIIAKDFILSNKVGSL